MKRRDFLRGTATAATAMAFPAVVPGHVFAAAGRLGANDRIQVGVIGLGGRAARFFTTNGCPMARSSPWPIASSHDAKKPPSSSPVARSGPSSPATRPCSKRPSSTPCSSRRRRTPRVRAAIHVAQSGRDVYCEKPQSLYITEGRALVNAIKKTGRILQTGSQQRSMPINQFGSKLVREGAIGKVKEVITFNFWPPQVWYPREAEPIPAGLDWNEWCNQTDLRPYARRLQFGWGLYADYDGGGQSWGVTGWGTHSLDQVQCGLGTDDTGPIEIKPTEPGENCPVHLTYANGTVLKLVGPKRSYEDLGAIFVGEKGTIEIRRGSCVANPKELLTGAPPDSPSVKPGETVDHLKNFFECVRTRKKPNADVETGHRATSLCHLINICRAVQRKLRWDPAAEKFISDDEANLYLSRPRRKGFELPVIG